MKTVEVVRTVRSFPWLRTIAVMILLLWIGWHYWVYPAIDRITPWEGIKPNPSMPNIPGTPWPLIPDPPWDGIIPGSCATPSAPEQEELSGFPAMWHDLGSAIRSLAEGPPSPETMRGWFTDAGAATAEAVSLVGAGLHGQPIPLAPLPAAPAPLQVAAPGAPEDVAAAALLAAGATPQEAVALTAIAGPESQWNPLADNPTSTATGLWQILDMHGLTVQERQDPHTAARKALELAREPNGINRHWAQTVAASKQYEARASAAVARVAACASPSDPGAKWASGRMPDAALVPAQGEQRLERHAAAAFQMMAAAFERDLGKPLILTSGYRSYEQQVALHAAKPRLAAPAGRSNHGHGVAADLGSGVQAFGTTAHRWMQTNAARFGWFHPEWAQAGGSKPEPWHWEFAGAATAAG